MKTAGGTMTANGFIPDADYANNQQLALVNQKIAREQHIIDAATSEKSKSEAEDRRQKFEMEKLRISEGGAWGRANLAASTAGAQGWRQDDRHRAHGRGLRAPHEADRADHPGVGEDWPPQLRHQPDGLRRRRRQDAALRSSPSRSRSTAPRKRTGCAPSCGASPVRPSPRPRWSARSAPTSSSRARGPEVAVQKQVSREAAMRQMEIGAGRAAGQIGASPGAAPAGRVVDFNDLK